MANVSTIQSPPPIQTASEPSDRKTFEPSTPVLKRMFELHTSFGQIGDKLTGNILDRIEHEQADLTMWTKQQMDHLIAVANRSWYEQGWSMLQAVAESVISIASCAVGGYFLSQGGNLEAFALISFGVFNIVQTVFARQQMWDWVSETLAEKNAFYRDNLKKMFPFVVALISLGFSMAGVNIASNLMPNATIELLKQAQGVFSLLGQLVNSGLSIKKSVDNIKLTNIQGEMSKHQNILEGLTRFLDSLMKEHRRIKSTIKKPMQELMQAMTRASQRV